MTINQTLPPVGMQRDLHPPAGPAIFSADADDELLKAWGPVLSVFAASLASVYEEAEQNSPGCFDTPDDMQAAARRYGALLEVICGSSDGGKRPCTVYDCCDGFSVLMLPQLPVTAQEKTEALIRFETEKTAVDEKVFGAVLSRALGNFFRDNVPHAESLVTVTVAGSDYSFMRSEQRDVILRKLHIASSAESY